MNRRETNNLIERNNELIKKLKNIARYDPEVFESMMGVMFEMAPDTDGNYVRWEDIEEILNSFS